MPPTANYLPGFKAICSGVAVTYVALGGSMVLRGARESMQQFAVPEATLASPHFQDFFQFLFVHMMVIGLLIGVLGRFVDEGQKQQRAARILFFVELLYTCLDVRTSDSVLGNALYKGAGSLMPVLIDVIVLSCFGYLSVRPLRSGAARAP